MAIISRNGAPILRVNGTVRMRYDPQALNWFAWGNTRVWLESDHPTDGPFRLVVEIDAGITPPAGAKLVLMRGSESVGIPFPEAPVVGNQTIADTWSIAFADDTVAMLLAVDGDGRVGAQRAAVPIALRNNAPAIVGATIDGTGYAGSEHTAIVEALGSGTITVSVQWYLDEDAVEGETGETFTPAAGDAGRELTFDALATSEYGSYGPVTSAPVVLLDIAIPFAVTVNPTLDAPTEGEPLTGNGPTFTAPEGVEWAWVYQMAEDASGTGAEGIPDTAGICPEIDGALDHLRRGALFTGVEPEDEGPYWSDWQEIEAAAVTTPVTLVSPALVAENLVALDGITDATFTPGATITAGSATATIVEFVEETGDLFLGPITSGPIADDAVVTASSGGAGVANGASVAWQITAGEPIYIRPEVWAGTPTETTVIQRIANDSNGAGAVVVELSGSTPPHYGTKFYEREGRASGYLAAPYISTTTGWLPIGIPTLDPLEDEDWYLEVVAEPGGGERVAAIWLRDGLNATAFRWTTSSQAQIDANPFPAGHEPCTRTETTETISATVFRRWTTSPAVYNGRDFVVFSGTIDETRRTRFGGVAQIGGAWTPLGDRKTVALLGVPDSDGSMFSRFINRSEAQEQIGEPGGDCMQFPRAWGTDGDYLIKAYDVTYPTETTNFGDDWFSEGCDGLFMSQSTAGLCVDGDYVHGMFGALFMRAVQASYRAAEGIYRKRRSTGKWTRRAALPDILGSNTGAMRVNQRYIAKVAGSGSGPETRTLFAIHAPATAISAYTTIQILKSTNGGDTWANDGSTLSVATHGRPVEIWADSTALYMNTQTRTLRRAFGGTTWTVATGLPAGNCCHIEKHGSKIYVLVKGLGLYVANDAATLAFSPLKTGNYVWFSVSPVDTNRIVLFGASPTGTHNANAGSPTWFSIQSQPYPGQTASFKSALGGSSVWCQFHDTDPDRLVAMRFQHPGKSTDGGRTFFWASRNEDYSEIRSIAFHRTDYRRIILGMTDRLMTGSDHGAAFIQDDGVTDGNKSTLKSLTGQPSALTAQGCIVLDRGTRTGYVSQAGGTSSTKTPMIPSRLVSLARTAASTGNGDVAISASPDLPSGTYKLTCTAAASNGGTFTGVGPLGISLGTWTVGTPRTFTHPRGGTLAVTISDGSTDFKAGANPHVITITVSAMGGAVTILDPSVKDQAIYGAVNPAVGWRGISGRHVFEMNTAGAISLARTMAYSFAGYLGRGGSAILGYSGNSTLMRSPNEGVSWSTFASNLGNFAGRGRPVICASSHDDLRAYVGCNNGVVKKIQNGAVSAVFDFNAWCVANGISGGWPGLNGANVALPPVSGVVESWYDPNLVYVALYLFGGPYMLFRTKNALAATPVWENITVDSTGRGIFHPIQSMFIHPITDEPIVTSSHGNIMVRPEEAHRNAHGITASLIDDLRAGPGGSYHATAPL